MNYVAYVIVLTADIATCRCNIDPMYEYCSNLQGQIDEPLPKLKFDGIGTVYSPPITGSLPESALSYDMQAPPYTKCSQDQPELLGAELTDLSKVNSMKEQMNEMECGRQNEEVKQSWPEHCEDFSYNANDIPVDIPQISPKQKPFKASRDYQSLNNLLNAVQKEWASPNLKARGRNEKFAPSLSDLQISNGDHRQEFISDSHWSGFGSTNQQKISEDNMKQQQSFYDPQILKRTRQKSLQTFDNLARECWENSRTPAREQSNAFFHKTEPFSSEMAERPRHFERAEVTPLEPQWKWEAVDFSKIENELRDMQRLSQA